MKAHPEASIEIIGHSHNVGKEGVDMLLSQKRTDSVRRYLIDKFGIEKSRIHTLGTGLINRSPTIRQNRGDRKTKESNLSFTNFR